MDTYQFCTTTLKASLLLIASTLIIACEFTTTDTVQPKQKPYTESVLVRPCTPQTCYIYYDDFAIKRAFGLGESQIDKYYATKYNFDENDLAQIFQMQIPSPTHSCNDGSYCNIDVKAKIVLNKKVFYIDSSGYMQSDKSYYKIDQDKIVEILSTREPLEVLKYG